jgi:hypothetical protein
MKKIPINLLKKSINSLEKPKRMLPLEQKRGEDPKVDLD